MQKRHFRYAILTTVAVLSLEGAAGAGCCHVKLKIKNPIKTVAQVVHDTGKAVGKATEDVVHAGGKAAEDTSNAVAKAVDDTNKATEKAAQDTVNTVEKAGQDTGKAAEKAVQDTGKAVEKAAQDTRDEGKRAVANVGEFGEAVGRFANRAVTDTKDNLSDAEKRLREGKVADTFWHLAVDPLKDSEERAAKLAQESTLANAVGQVAASVYGGPGGAAAYAAWYTYRTTGDAELALRVGIISGATSAAMSAVNVQPSMAQASAAARAGTAPLVEVSLAETAKKAALAGAIGGIAVAAAGGDADAIRDGFLKGGGMVLVQDGFKAFTGQQGMYAEGAERPAFCTTSLPVSGAPGSACAPRPEWFKTDASGKTVLDMSKVPPDTSYVGLATDAAKPAWPTSLTAETGPLMNAVAKVPGMNAMSIFHDQWVISWDMTGPAVQATIIPAVVLTYMGTEAPLQSAIQDAAAPKPLSAEVKPAGAAIPSASSYLAVKGGISRAFFVAEGTNPNELACVVVYQQDVDKGGPDLAPWYALKDVNYCDIKIEELARRHVDEGWNVMVR